MDYTRFCKPFISIFAICTLVFVAACTVNPATGDKQFTGLMSPSQEKALGAEQHQEVIKEFGGVYNHPGLQAYVNDIGQRIAKNTERGDVAYRFTLLDSPVVNAFALPGGYIYVTRGILSLANDEDELASVLAHEVGHITARHQSERYSTGVLTALGASIIASVAGTPGVSQALNVGTNLYMSSYSRDQESQADQLGIRYLSRAGYDPFAMSRFLNQLDRHDRVSKKSDGSQDRANSFFSTHPVTAERVAATSTDAGKYPPHATQEVSQERYLSKLRGMIYGDNVAQGFVRNHTFYHPDLGISFSVPSGYETINQPEQFIAKGDDGGVMVMNMARGRGGSDPSVYLMRDWLQGKTVAARPESISINGMPAATLAVDGTFNNAPASIRLVAIAWRGQDFVRFQMVIPKSASRQTVENLKRATYSFRNMSAQEKQTIQPTRIDLVTARTGDTAGSLARQMQVDGHSEEWFRVLNGLGTTGRVVTGKRYKVVR
ncbi:MAG TPA: M48 family metalloprotease [Alphaproteobacteria bacterium]|nr:M48 family metalloprotease [Alphaproteobacteria bacterium]HRK97356.1 M48 family metalloprotease [Alphaproteobacteria bacterium]